MRLLTKYVLREFLIPLFYCMTGFVAIFVLFELSASFSRLLEAKLPFTTILSFFCGYLAPYFMWLAPAALMLATLYTMWSFCRHSEIIAMRASGLDQPSEYFFIDIQVANRTALCYTPSLPLENLKIAFPSKPACVFRLRAS